MIRKLLIESAFATALVFGVMGLFVSLPLNLEALQPLESAISNFDMMDIYYSKLGATEGQFSKNVMIVNIGDADREEIADLLGFISIGEPAAIGLDVYFGQPKDSFGDQKLSDAIQANSNIVMAAFIDETNARYLESNSLFHAESSGFTNFIGSDPRYATIRYFQPKVESELAFGAAISHVVDPSTTQEFLNACPRKSAIHYIGNGNAFLMFEKDEILNLDVEPEVFQDKVVLLGFLGNQIGDQFNVEDRMYTPLNERISGRSVPDMNGVVIHANIIEMILSKNWITLMPTWLKYILSVLITYIHVVLFMYLIIKWDLYFDALAKVLQLISTLLLLFIVFQVYHHLNYRIYITPALVGVALAVDILFIYEAIVHTLYARFKIKSILIDPS